MRWQKVLCELQTEHVKGLLYFTVCLQYALELHHQDCRPRCPSMHSIHLLYIWTVKQYTSSLMWYSAHELYVEVRCLWTSILYDQLPFSLSHLHLYHNYVSGSDERLRLLGVPVDSSFIVGPSTELRYCSRELHLSREFVSFALPQIITAPALYWCIMAREFRKSSWSRQKTSIDECYSHVCTYLPIKTPFLYGIPCFYKKIICLNEWIIAL